LPFALAFGRASSSDRAYGVTRGNDGSYYAAGRVSNGTNYDACLVKFDMTGALSWYKPVDVYSNQEYGYDCAPTSDDGVVIAGYGYNSSTYYGVFLSKFNSAGTHQWTRSSLGSTTNGNVCYAITKTADNGFAITGYTGEWAGTSYTSAFLYKFNSSGTLLWGRAYRPSSTSYSSYGRSVTELSDGSLIVAGYYSDGSYSRPLVFKYNSSGTFQWAYYLNTGTNTDIFQGITLAADGNVVAAGYSYSLGGSTSYPRFFAVKYNSSTGAVMWARTVNNYSGSGADIAYSIACLTDGGLVLSGYVHNGTDQDIAIVKLDASGAFVSARRSGTTGADIGYGVYATPDNGFILGGYSNSWGTEAGSGYDYFVAKYDNTAATCIGSAWTTSVTSHTLSNASPSCATYTLTNTFSSVTPTIRTDTYTRTNICP
jgi:uncharacterized delta-60 repeat protein